MGSNPIPMILSTHYFKTMGYVFDPRVPQADILSFGPTMVILPVCFLGGYFFFVTRWVPRLLLTYKARNWLTQFRVLPLGVLTPAGEGWPEIFLLFIQFGGLLFFISLLTLVTPPGEEQRLQPFRVTPPEVSTFEVLGGLPGENFFFLWGTHREELLFRPSGVELTSLLDRLLGGFTFYTPGKQFPHLGAKLRQRLAQEATKLSLFTGEAHTGV